MSTYSPESAQVSVANWQSALNLRWAFRHMGDIVATHLVAPSASARPLPTSARRLPSHTPVRRLSGEQASLEEVLLDTHTDALIVLHEGKVVGERYFAGMTPSTRHLAMSVTKSVVGCVAGVLVGRGLIEVERPVTDYVPELADSGYAGARVRDVLDMRTGVAYREEYTDPDAEVRVMERSAGWSPLRPGDPVGLYHYLTTLRGSGPHAGPFVYRSADTDVLGWVCERATGTGMAELVSELIWFPLGAEDPAELTCDVLGTAVHDGGLCATPRDLAKFGQLLLDGGVAHGSQVVPAAWLAETFRPGADVREAFAGTPNDKVLPRGWYRNQFWFLGAAHGSPVLLCLGIHGQLVYVDPATRTVIVKMSCWPEAQNIAHLVDTLRACGAIAEQLVAGPATLVG